MKQFRFPLKWLSVLMAFCVVFTALNMPVSVFADDEYANLSLEEKQALIEQKLKETNEKLESLGEQSKETQEYIDTLDEKISYLKNELDLSENEIDESKGRITQLEQEYKDNEEKIETLEKDIEALSKKNASIKKQFDKRLDLYCERLRVLYISGDMSLVSILLNSPDISTLLTRLEMIRRVSKYDKELLESIENEGRQLNETKASLEEKQNSLSDNQYNLKQTSVNLSQTVEQLEQQQSSYKEKQTAYESEKDNSDHLLQQLHQETDTYSEYRNQDLAELEQINSEIQAAAERFRQQMEEKNKTTTTTQPQTQATTQADENAENTTDNQSSTTDLPETTEQTTEATTQSDPEELKMTFPVPSQTVITCDWGSAGYEGHTGVDFSCNEGSEVVAAESGYVLISADLYNDMGDYRSYGRYIVIAHDKLNSQGQYVYTLYAHNSQRIVSEGQYVKKGQLIAYSGTTGNSTGPHCHFEVRTPDASYSNCVNPNIYLP